MKITESRLMKIVDDLNKERIHNYLRKYKTLIFPIFQKGSVTYEGLEVELDI